MKLFSLGDSISQGFMSGATAKTDLCFSTLIAKKLGLKASEYKYPSWDKGGIPLNIEDIFRRLNKELGSNIKGPFEWTKALFMINRYLDGVEDYYEREKGALHEPTSDKVKYYNNVSVRGFDVGDAWKVDAATGRKIIQNNAGNRDKFLFGTPNQPLLRTAVKILNPSLHKKYDHFTQLDWLREHATHEGVKHTVLWLGSNNALGTVLGLKINQTPGDGSPKDLSYTERREKGWNLWHPVDFEAEYTELLKRVMNIMKNNREKDWHLFIGNVPLVTIAPLIKGVGPTTEFPELGMYFKYYTYFPFTEDFAHETGLHLNMQQALHIDKCIIEYNKTIQSLITEANHQLGNTRLHLVNVSQALRDMALKRNSYHPTYEFPPYFDFIYPKVDTKFYHADASGDLKQGGIFSLDGVHPSAIGQGLVAWEFLKVMRTVDNTIQDLTTEDWRAIFASDSLYSQPISLMQEVYEHETLAEYIYKTMQFFRD